MPNIILFYIQTGRKDIASIHHAISPHNNIDKTPFVRPEKSEHTWETSSPTWAAALGSQFQPITLKHMGISVLSHPLLLPHPGASTPRHENIVAPHYIDVDQKPIYIYKYKNSKLFLKILKLIPEWLFVSSLFFSVFLKFESQTFS